MNGRLTNTEIAKIKIRLRAPNTEQSSEAEFEIKALATHHPELAIHTLPDNSWAVIHIPSGEMVIYGLPTEELAWNATCLLWAAGLSVGPPYTSPLELSSVEAYVGWREQTFKRFFRGNPVDPRVSLRGRTNDRKSRGPIHLEAERR